MKSHAVDREIYASATLLGAGVQVAFFHAGWTNWSRLERTFRTRCGVPKRK
ncbi:hypothetical protein [Burkholderia sp. PU8-34]